MAKNKEIKCLKCKVILKPFDFNRWAYFRLISEGNATVSCAKHATHLRGRDVFGNTALLLIDKKFIKII